MLKQAAALRLLGGRLGGEVPETELQSERFGLPVIKVEERSILGVAARPAADGDVAG